MQRTYASNHANSRRKFLTQAAALTAGVGMTSLMQKQAFSTQQSATETVIGSGDYQYKIDHQCVELPSQFKWQITHNVAVDSSNRLYVIHEGQSKLKEHPAIFVFDSDGKYIQSFGSEYQGGGHGLEVRKEGGEEFLYVTGYQGIKFFSKMTLDGEEVFRNYAPVESGRYAEGEATDPKQVWGRDRFMPTNIAFLSDGSFFVADGYGAWCVHHYDKDGKYLSSFGGQGKDDGQFSLPHGIWTDSRSGTEEIVVADRANNRLQWFTPGGEHLRTMDGFLLPANVDTKDELMLVPELQSRVSLVDKEGNIVAALGDDADWRKAVGADRNKMRTQPERWEDGKFIHPHDACFDAEGNIFVAEWVATGRVSKLTRVV